jgi:arylformamidase
MRLIDLSQPLFNDAPNCPLHPPVVFRQTADHPQAGWRMEEIAMATHIGSHLDAPLHKIAGGKVFPICRWKRLSVWRALRTCED